MNLRMIVLFFVGVSAVVAARPTALRPAPKAPQCDVCGCGSGGYTLGILPQLHKNFVGVRYRYQSFDSHEDHSHHSGLPESSSESFQAVEWWARVYPLRRLQVLALVPYQFHQRTVHNETSTRHVSGLGDVSLLVSYQVRSNVDSAAQKLKYTLWIGGGLKLPTGQWNRLEDGLTMNPNFQLGSGSVDGMLQSLFTLRYRNLGLHLDGSYRVCGKNKNEYRFGNRLQATVSAFYVHTFQSVTLMPYAGIYRESIRAHRQFDQPIDLTAGQAGFAQLGMEGYWKKLSVGVLHQTPVRQHLSGGNSVAHARWTTHLTFLL